MKGMSIRLIKKRVAYRVLSEMAVHLDANKVFQTHSFFLTF